MIKRLCNYIEQRKDLLKRASDEIWELAELKFEEYESVRILCSILEKEGFTIDQGVAGMDTAFIASYSNGETCPIIGIIGEYDALSGMSQKSGLNEQMPITEGGNGHGCGHHLLGVGMVGACIALKQLLEEENIEGTIRFYGCPAEEGGSGKTYMVREGLFEDVDVALTWHPGYENAISQWGSLANYQVYYRFKGKSSHASMSPHLGRSALDAVELMNVGVNYLREHIIPEARVHCAITNSGSDSPNVVPADAEVLYLIRAPLLRDVQHIYDRVNNIAKGAALMTGTEVGINFDKGCSNLILNHSLNKIMHETFKEIGIPIHTEEEQELARIMTKTIPSFFGRDSLVNKLSPLDSYERIGSMSTDVGDVSWVVPTVQCGIVCFAKQTAFHSWQMVSQGKSSISHKGMIHASKVVAATGLHLLLNPDKIKEAQQEWANRLSNETYISPIPKEVLPPRKQRNISN